MLDPCLLLLLPLPSLVSMSEGIFIKKIEREKKVSVSVIKVMVYLN